MPERESVSKRFNTEIVTFKNVDCLILVVAVVIFPT